jgi:hypothetical protein
LRQTDQNAIAGPDCTLLGDNNDPSMAWKSSRYAAVQPASPATAPHLSFRADPESPYSPLNRLGSTSRDFVPWRFSDARNRSAP